MTALQSLQLGFSGLPPPDPNCPMGMLQGLTVPPPADVLTPMTSRFIQQGPPHGDVLHPMGGAGRPPSLNFPGKGFPPPLLPSSKQFPPHDPSISGPLAVPEPLPVPLPGPWEKDVLSLPRPPSIPKPPTVKEECVQTLAPEDFRKILTDLVGPKKEAFQNIPTELVGELKEMQQGVSRLAGTSKKLLEFGVSARLNKLDELSRVEEEKLTSSQLAEKRRLVRLEKNRRAASVSRERKRSYVRSLEERSLIMAKHLAALETENLHLRQMMRSYQNGGNPNDVPPLILPPGATPTPDLSMIPQWGGGPMAPGMPNMPFSDPKQFVKCAGLANPMKMEPVPAPRSPLRPGRRKRKMSRSRGRNNNNQKKKKTMIQSTIGGYPLPSIPLVSPQENAPLLPPLLPPPLLPKQEP